MDVNLLNNHLLNNPENIHKVLESIGITNITFNQAKNTMRFSREEGRNPTSSVINVDTLQYFCFSDGSKGNLFTLIMSRVNCNFRTALEHTARALGLSKNELEGIRVVPPFGGFYRSLSKTRQEEELPEIYPEETLEPYAGKYNLQFFRDGIDFKTQELFGVGYDVETSRITIPERYIDGSLIGIMGRSNVVNCDHDMRWLPIIPCSRNNTLFGYAANYKSIVEKGNVVLCESEKGTLQAHSFGSNIVLGLGGCRISRNQVKYIRMLHPKNIYLAFDEGLPEEQIEEEARKLLSKSEMIRSNVFYFWDGENEIVPKDSKNNIFDMGRDAYITGLKQYSKQIK